MCVFFWQDKVGGGLEQPLALSRSVYNLDFVVIFLRTGRRQRKKVEHLQPICISI